MAILASHRSVWPVFAQPYFWGMLTLTTCCTFGINYGIDYGMHKMNETFAVINGGNFLISVFAVVVIIDTLVFFGAGDLRKRIIDGKVAPIAQSALCDTLFKRVLLFSLAVPNWKDRYPRFVAQTLLFPGLFVVIVVYAACFFSSGGSSLPENACVVPLHDYLAITEAWKAFIAICAYTINFAAYHNDAQPELYPEGASLLIEGEPNPGVAQGIPVYRNAAEV